VVVHSQEISAEILEACRRGDRDAFRALYEAYKDKVYSIALYFFHGDHAAASDATQQVFMKLLTSVAQFRGRSGFSTWLYRLVVNACIDGQRRSKSGGVATDPAVLDALPEPGSHEQHFAMAETRASVQTAIASLPAAYRLAILLRYFEDLSYEEMAEALNCSIGTVASRLNRGHRLLAARLAPLRASLDPRQ
jgi:RNA polymerase sigma-70 factor (ECF subfamily)